MATIVQNIQEVHRRIAAACAAAQRPAHSVTLLVVGKTFAAEQVRAAFDAGERSFGENQVQEGTAKIAALADARDRIQWHLIGPLQSNKSRAVAEAFDWVHTVDRLKIAQRLAEQRPPLRPPLQVCLQVNISGEASKNGLAADQVRAVARAVALLPRITLRGLMAVPAPAFDAAAQRAPHALLRELLSDLQRDGLDVDTLSMGMTADLEAAIAEGATIVRVGSAIFGAR